MLGDGSSTFIWENPWIPDYLGFIPKPKEGNSPNNNTIVLQLFNQSRSGWNDSKLHDLFESDCVVFIKKLSVLTLLNAVEVKIKKEQEVKPKPEVKKPKNPESTSSTSSSGCPRLPICPQNPQVHTVYQVRVYDNDIPSSCKIL